MRYAASVAYDGSAYHGWQRQKHSPETVQAHVERALSQVANHDVTVICAGRTDTGVHGTSQIIHFDSDASRDQRAWVYGSNAALPDAIALNWVKPVDDEFHARFDAFARRYQYVIFNHPIRPALFNRQMTWQYRPLDLGSMQRAAEHLLGEHDFTSFRAVACQAKSAVKTVHHLELHRQGDYIVLDIRANAFLQHMVRNVAGSLMAVGAGRQSEAWIVDVLAARDRRVAAATAPPYGLYFVGVSYPEGSGLGDCYTPVPWVNSKG